MPGWGVVHEVTELSPDRAGQLMHCTIHGHFYQPPRENPWTGEIQRQDSASPFHDWNERITDECYGPNGRSRVLDSQGRITAIVNNFAHLSFDFGPTLLSDLERRFPQVYRRVLDADRESVARHGGHGAAFAQAYNHMILPLANRHDKQTQIRWGLRDFAHRFGRPSEGIWLPETAIDAETLQIVADEGVRFLVLAPHQALRVRPMGEKRWVETHGQIDSSRAYRCFADSSRRRWVDCFFYDGSLSVAVSFEHLLRDAAGFAGRLESAGRGRPPEALVHLATDGEVYGHHEPFADMCLAYLFTSEGARRGIRFVNYPEYLDLRPPADEVFLNFTDTGEGTAWSCAHGVGRWNRDCGCSTGGAEGWNQRWRTPLRRGLDAVRDQVQSAFLSLCSRHLVDPWAARDDYIDLIRQSDPDRRAAFLARHARGPIDEEGRRTVWSLLEASHQAMLMYTSCAWFFADISGLEVQQNLAYAARACELAQPYCTEPLEALLLTQLEQAKSNLPEWKHGAHVYRSLIVPRRVGPEHVAAQAALEAAALDRSLDRRVFGFTVSGRLDPGSRTDESECSGHLRVQEEALEQSWAWDFHVTDGSLPGRIVHLRPSLDREASLGLVEGRYRLLDFQREVRFEIAGAALGQSLEDQASRLQEIFEEARAPLEVLTDLNLPMPEIHRHLGSHVLGRAGRDLAAQIDPEGASLPVSWWARLESVMIAMQRLRLPVDVSPLTTALIARVHARLDRALAEADPALALEAVRAAYGTLAAADRLALPLHRTWLEPRVYELVLRFRAELNRRHARPPAAEPAGIDDDLASLEALAGHANLNLESILQSATADRR